MTLFRGPETTFSEIASLIADHYAISTDRQRLIFAGQLQSPGAKLSDRGLYSGSRIFLAVQPPLELAESQPRSQKPASIKPLQDCASTLLRRRRSRTASDAQ